MLFQDSKHRLEDLIHDLATGTNQVGHACWSYGCCSVFTVLCECVCVCVCVDVHVCIVCVCVGVCVSLCLRAPCRRITHHEEQALKLTGCIVRHCKYTSSWRSEWPSE